VLQKILAFPFYCRQRRLAGSRASLPEAQFVSMIDEMGGDGRAAHIIYQHLQGWIVYEHFTAYPHDSLEKIFGIAEEERDEDLVLALLHTVGCSPSKFMTLAGKAEVDTSVGIARLIVQSRDT
jgi:hypothetical protein